MIFLAARTQLAVEPALVPVGVTDAGQIERGVIQVFEAEMAI